MGSYMSGDNSDHIGPSGVRLSQTGEHRCKSKRLQREIIPSRLENVVSELLRSLCVCIVHVKINNEELFFNAFPFENSYYFISG